MIAKLTIRSFKSLADVELSLGLVNVFVGANGSGKSNLLEAVGVLSAAAGGRVDDESLMRRGVRPGVPKLYKSAFPGRQPLHIFFGAETQEASYEVTLFNPISDPKPAWRYHTESWKRNGESLLGRSHRMFPKSNPEAGMAALRAAELELGDPALTLLDLLRNYTIYEPNTRTLRGITSETQPRLPVGLAGGGLPLAVLNLLHERRKNEWIKDEYQGFKSLIDWAKMVGAGPSYKLPLSASAGNSKMAVRFVDRFMAEGRNVLSGADASEGALYVLFAAVIALDEKAPGFLAIDNADHGLNPSLARALMQQLCRSILGNPKPRQLLLTTHNPLVLDGIPINDERVRLFTVDRDNRGRTIVKRVTIDEKLLTMASQGWTLSRLWTNKLIGGMPNV